MAPAPLSTRFQSLPVLPTIKLGPSGAGSRVGGLCTPRAPVGLSNDLSCEAGSLSCCRPNPHGCFLIRGLRLYFVALEPWVLPFVPVYLWVNVGPLGATHRSACPVLCHSESGPLGLSVRECGAAGSATAALPALFSATLESGPLSLSLCECGATGCASGQTACPIRPTLRQSRSRHGSASPLRPAPAAHPPLLPVWMNVYFLFPWCRTSLPFDFLSVLVVRGCTVCLPTPPSWFSPQYSYY